MITFVEAHEHLRYEPDTGKLRWRVRTSGRRMNKPAGAKTNGYISVYVLGKMYRASRLIWFLPMIANLGVLPVAAIEAVVSRRFTVRANAQQRTKGIEGVEAPVKAERKFVEVSLQVFRLDAAVMRPLQPRFQV